MLTLTNEMLALRSQVLALDNEIRTSIRWLDSMSRDQLDCFIDAVNTRQDHLRYLVKAIKHFNGWQLTSSLNGNLKK